MSATRGSRRSAGDLRDEALRLLADAIQKPPAELKGEVDVAEQAVAALRDELIERLRSAPDAHVRGALDKVNVALTLLVGLEYPMGGLQGKMIEEARDVLNSVEASPQFYCP